MVSRVPQPRPSRAVFRGWHSRREVLIGPRPHTNFVSLVTFRVGRTSFQTWTANKSPGPGSNRRKSIPGDAFTLCRVVSFVSQTILQIPIVFIFERKHSTFIRSVVSFGLLTQFLCLAVLISADSLGCRLQIGLSNK